VGGESNNNNNNNKKRSFGQLLKLLFWPTVLCGHQLEQDREEEGKRYWN